MPSHRNESADQKTMTFKNSETFVRENHHLSRERATVFTQISSDGTIFMPEYVFKGSGKRPPTLKTPEGMHYQWALKGSYRLEQMVETIKRLPNNHNPFTQANYDIYVFDNYAVHLMPEIRAEFLKRGYVPVLIRGGITGYIQLNDTHVHHPLKSYYREEEATLMMQKLQDDRTKVPAPTREEMMDLTAKANARLNIDVSSAFEQLLLTNALDGSEDYLVSDRIMRLVGTKMREIREELLAQPVPKTLKELERKLIPPKGIKWSFNLEGSELLDDGNIDSEDEGSEEDTESSSSEDENDDEENNEERSGEEINEERSGEEITNEERSGEEITNEGTSQNVGNVMLPGDEISLAGLSNDPEVNRDAEFLDAMSLTMEGHETSLLFLPFRNQLNIIMQNARRSVKRRIANSKD